MSGNVNRPGPTHHSAHATAAQAAADAKPRAVTADATDATHVRHFYATFVSMQQRRAIRYSFLSLVGVKGKYPNRVPKEVALKILFHFCEYFAYLNVNIAALNRMRYECSFDMLPTRMRERALALFDAQYPGSDINRLIAFEQDTGMSPCEAEKNPDVRKDFITSGFSILSESVSRRGALNSLPLECLSRLPRALEDLEGDDNSWQLDLCYLKYIPEWFHAVLPRFESLFLRVTEAGIPDCFQHACNLQSLIVYGEISKLPEWVNVRTFPKLQALDIRGNAFSPEAVYDIKKTFPLRVDIFADYQVGNFEQMNRFWLILLFIWRLMQS